MSTEPIHEGNALEAPDRVAADRAEAVLAAAAAIIDGADRASGRSFVDRPRSVPAAPRERSPFHLGVDR